MSALRLSDAFLASVAAKYQLAVAERKRPAKSIADEFSCSVRTVHGWVRMARARGILPPTTQGAVTPFGTCRCDCHRSES